jgi:hypothetical protein
LFWQVNGSPELWPTIFYNLQEGEYEVYKMGFAEFLVKVFNLEIESVLIYTELEHTAGKIQFKPEL